MKRIFLISLLLVVVLGFSVSALDPGDLPFKPTLTVGLDVPEDIQINVPFNVDVYVTPFIKSDVLDAEIQVVSNSLDLVFKDATTAVQAMFKPTISSSVVTFTQLTPKIIYNYNEKTKIGSIQMVVTQPGSYEIVLQKQNSKADYSGGSYVLTMSTVTFCSSELTPCSDLGAIKIGSLTPQFANCGLVDDGCGKVVSCGVCNQDEFCINNACIGSNYVIKSDLEMKTCQGVLGTQEPGKTLLVGISSALKEQTFNAKFNGIVTALTTWFKVAKQ